MLSDIRQKLRQLIELDNETLLSGTQAAAPPQKALTLAEVQAMAKSLDRAAQQQNMGMFTGDSLGAVSSAAAAAAAQQRMYNQASVFYGHSITEWGDLKRVMDRLDIRTPAELVQLLEAEDHPLRDRVRAVNAEYKLKKISDLLKDLNEVSTKE